MKLRTYCTEHRPSWGADSRSLSFYLINTNVHSRVDKMAELRNKGTQNKSRTISINCPKSEPDIEPCSRYTDISSHVPRSQLYQTPEQTNELLTRLALALDVSIHKTFHLGLCKSKWGSKVTVFEMHWSDGCLQQLRTNEIKIMGGSITLPFKK
jgi:hypothetical protein